MIVPTKHIPQHEALIGVGATLLRYLRSPKTVSDLWDKVKDEENVATFERFVLAANLLYLMGALELRDGLLARAQP